MTRDLEFTEFVDFLLVRLYELDRETSARMHNLSEIAAELATPVPRKWVQDALQVLDASGWVKDWGADNGFFGEITGSGRLYVEGRQHNTALIEQYRENPSNFVVVTGSHNQVSVGNQGDTTQVSINVGNIDKARSLLADMRSTLEGDHEIDDETRADALADVQAIEGQLSKREPNRHVITSLLGGLGAIASIAQLAVDVGQLLT